MPTKMTFELSTTLLDKVKVANNGAYVFAFAFDQNGNLVTQATLVENGSLNSLELQLTGTGEPGSLPKHLVGGNVIVVTQQVEPGTTSDLDKAGVITTIGQLLNTDNAKTLNFRYDAIEVTLQGSGSDVADLTNIVQFGAPISLSVSYEDNPTPATRGYAVSGQTIVDVLAGNPPKAELAYPWTSWGPQPTPTPTPTPPSPFADTEQRETLSLSNNKKHNPLNDPSYWNSYVDKFGGIASDVRIATIFNGVNSAGQPYLPASVAYFNVQFQDGKFWLVPIPLDIPGVATTNGVIGMTPTELTQNIYSQTGTLYLYQSIGDTAPVKTYLNDFTPNNAYGDVSKYFVAGFDAGYWGATANALNEQPGVTVNLNQPGTGRLPMPTERPVSLEISATPIRSATMTSSPRNCSTTPTPTVTPTPI